jgi:hypothetical protein
MAVYTEPSIDVEEDHAELGAPDEEEILTRAETAECTCPEFCERDHDNE